MSHSFSDELSGGAEGEFNDDVGGKADLSFNHHHTKTERTCSRTPAPDDLEYSSPTVVSNLHETNH